MAQDKKRQTLYMDNEMHKQIEWLADIEGRSVNAQYVQMLREGIARRLSQSNSIPVAELTQAAQ